MKDYFRISLVLLAAFLLSACYESKVPMASSKDSIIDQKLIGKWKGNLKRVVAEGDAPAELLFLKFNDHEYYVGYQVEENGKVEHHNLRAYIVKVDGVPFLNVQNIDDLKEEERTFLFFKYAVSEDGGLTLHMVSDGFVTTEFKTSDKLYEFIRNNVNKKELYEEPIQFKMVKSSR